MGEESKDSGKKVKSTEMQKTYEDKQTQLSAPQFANVHPIDKL